MRAVALAVALLASLAGCSGGGPPATGGAGQEPSPPAELPRQLALDGCDGVTWTLHVPARPIQDELPPGYTVGTIPLSDVPPEAGPLGSVDIHAVQCEDVRLGTAARPPGEGAAPFRFAWVGTYLAAARGPVAGNHMYLFDVFAPCAEAPSICEVLRRDGWPVWDSTVDFAGQDVAVAAEGGPSFTLDAQTEDGNPRAAVTDRPFVFHHAEPAASMAAHRAVSGDLAGTVATCEGGALARTTPCGAAPVASPFQRLFLGGPLTLAVNATAAP